jgi:hypothetical protein
MSKIEVNQISSQCGSTLTIGQSGDTVTLASGATAAGFGSTGEVSWDTTKKTTGFTATSGVGYFCDTTSAAFTVTLPATPSAGNVVAVSDYTGTFATNNLTIGRNGSNINGAASDFIIVKSNTTAQFIYVDATEGWRLVFTGADSDLLSDFIIATGGTITCCGDYKIHTFTGPGTFTVSSAGTPSGSTTVDYLVVAGGGGAGLSGAGAGGFRESHSTPVSGCYTASPLATPTGITVSATTYPVTVGAGGAGGTNCGQGSQGNNSIFSSIISAGGARGTGVNSAGIAGGSGSGGGGCNGSSPLGGAGNTPPVSPPQGNPGGQSGPGASTYSAGGGGGATEAGQNAPSNTQSGRGGAGATTNISASPVAYAGGGGGSGWSATGGGGAGSPCGTGGAAGDQTTAGSPGTANRGGGGGAGGNSSGTNGAGGSGIVIIRYKFQ